MLSLQVKHHVGMRFVLAKNFLKVAFHGEQVVRFGPLLLTNFLVVQHFQIWELVNYVQPVVRQIRNHVVQTY